MPPEPRDPITPLEEAWISMHMMYVGLRKAGFSTFEGCIIMGMHLYATVKDAQTED